MNPLLKDILVHIRSLNTADKLREFEEKIKSSPLDELTKNWFIEEVDAQRLACAIAR